MFSGKVAISDLIDLYIPQREETMRARIEWRRGDEFGLSFLDAACATGGA
jgi:hypothetical protein